MEQWNTYRILAPGILAVLLLTFTISEWNDHRKFSSSATIDQNAEDALLEASQSIQRISALVEITADSLADLLNTEIHSGSSTETLHAYLEQADLWGSALFSDSVQVVWTGFAPDLQDLLNAKPNTLEFNIQDNVRFLQTMRNLPAEDGSKQSLIIRKKITQENILSLGKDLELAPEESYVRDTSFPVRFAFGVSEVKDALQSEPILLSDSTQIGSVYFTQKEVRTYVEQLSNKLNHRRFLFFLTFVITLFLLAVWGCSLLANKRMLITVLTLVSVLYVLVQLIFPLLQHQPGSVFIPLFLYLFHALYFLSLAVIVHRYVHLFSDPAKERKNGVHATYSFLLTGSTVAAILWYFKLSNDLINDPGIWLLDLYLVPSAEVALFYLFSSLFFLSILISSVQLFRHLLASDDTKKAYLITGFISGLLVIILLILPDGLQRTEIIAIVFLLLSAGAGYVLDKRLPSFVRSSRLRLFILLAFLSATFSYADYTSSYRQELNQRMVKTASDFSADEEEEVREITNTLLLELNRLLAFSSEPTFNDLAFDELMESLIRPEWLRYTISVQVINQEGDQFTDYTTRLAPPQWSTRFRIEELSIPFEFEQIRRERLRPVFRTRPINTPNARYSSFIRGWIPLYGDPSSNDIRGWILCSVYRELPDLKRPLRTVVQAGPNTELQYPMVVTEYKEGMSRRTAILGFPLNVPAPTVILPEIQNRASKDSVFFMRSVAEEQQLMELYMQKENGSVIRVARKKIEFNQYLFTFLRHFLLLTGIGLFLLVVLSLFDQKNASGRSRTFRDRLIDRFIVAGFLCLIALAATSYVILEQLNTRDVRNELFERLEILVLNLEGTTTVEPLQAQDLKQLVTNLNADASLFTDASLRYTTTPQIFSQHVLPEKLPWHIYIPLMNGKMSRVTEVTDIDDQQMMIGYMPWYAQDRNIAGIAAIPTFVKAPKFYERLLSTTSYLLAFFTLIFGLLMIGIGIVARQMTAPIEALQEGLKKISEGDLNTQLEVSVDDEIGTLTRAYNIMASRLSTLQRELAEREREAAWKEMAQQVAHEIKNPLTPMKLSLQHLQQQLENTATDMQSLRPHVGRIARNMIVQIDSLSRIASDFSRFGRPQMQEAELLDLQPLIRSVVEMYGTKAAVKMELNMADEAIVISGVGEDLRRVLINLLKNAQEAIGEAGTIAIHLDTIDQHARLRVSDTGTGISKQDLKQIFSPRFSTKSSGSGLGLAISKKIAEEHHGDLRVVSTDASGTTFEWLIPLADG